MNCFKAKLLNTWSKICYYPNKHLKLGEHYLHSLVLFSSVRLLLAVTNTNIGDPSFKSVASNSDVKINSMHF